MDIKLKVKKIKLLLTSGTDIISITLDEDSSFPNMNYDTTMKIECQQGYGEEYCKNIIGLKPEIIDVR